MERISVEELLREYVDAFALAGRRLSDGADRDEYRSHHNVARSLLARWQGGESEAQLRTALAVELVDYQANPPPGPQAEMVGAAFGAVCRVLGVGVLQPQPGDKPNMNSSM